MKKFQQPAIATLGAAVLSAALICAGTAQADSETGVTSSGRSGWPGDHSSYGFQRDLALYLPVAITWSPTDAVRLARVTCDGLDKGVSEYMVAQLAEDSFGVTAIQAAQMVYGAEYHFCPNHY